MGNDRELAHEERRYDAVAPPLATTLEAPMSARPPATYDHTQAGSMHRWFVAIGLLEIATGIVVGSVLANDEGRTIAILLAASGLFFAALSSAMAHLRVHDEGDALRIAFGPLPLFKRRVPYASIRSAQAIETSLLRHGIGIHMAAGGGWVWNVSRGAAVELALEKGRLIVGTDDAATLVSFVQSRLARR